MREISRFQLNVSHAISGLKTERGRERTPEETERLFEKFKASKQEPLRIAVALTLYFGKAPLEGTIQKELERFLRTRIRNAVEALIEEDDPEKIRILEERGMFGRTELEGFLLIARERGKSQALIGLMILKNEKYGYTQEFFEL